MESWDETFDETRKPDFEEISQFINNKRWNNFCDFITANYQLKAELDYSGCSAQKGWNIKFRKSGKSLCVAYPMPGFFILLIVIGHKEQEETEAMLPTASEYVQNLYRTTPFSLGGRWLMLEVRDEAVYADGLSLIQIRARAKKIR